MPNWCYNNVKIESFDPELTKQLKEAVHEDKELFNQFVPQPKFENDQDWYMWNIENWGTKWDAFPNNVRWEDDNTVCFTIDTAWGPPTKFWEEMKDLGFRITAYYLEEGMAFVGMFDDGDDEYIEYGHMSADDMETDLPEWVNEQFGLIDRKRDDEEYEEEEEEIEEVDDSEWERTEWYAGKVKPTRDGLYEVKTKSWPFIHKQMWQDGKWVLDNKVTEWRGISESQYLSLALDELNDEIAAVGNEIDYSRYHTILEKIMDASWRDSDDLNIGEDISDQPEIKIIFDGYGDLEDTDENGEYRYTERGNKNMESYAIFIHKDSGKEGFVFPEHELTPWALIHRPKEEVCIYAWYDVENDDWSINSLDETSDHEMTDEEVMEILETLDKRYFQ